MWTIIFFLLSLFQFLVFPNQVSASFEDTENGARPIGMGGAFVGFAENGDLLFYNPGGLGFFSGTEIFSFYAKPFGLDELAYGSLGVIHGLKWGGIGYALKFFGFALYRETTHQITVASRYENKLSYGITIRAMHLAIERYGSATTYGVDIGLLAKITETISWGFYTRNVNMPTIGKIKEKLPQLFSTGVSYKPTKELVINFDANKDIQFPTMVKFGIEYMILNHIAIRTGISTEPSRFSAGLGINWNKFRFDYAFTHHPDLAHSHQTSIAFQF